MPAAIGHSPVTHRWSGQILDPIDYAAFIGRNPGNDHVFVHTGNSGQGLIHGVAGSLLLLRLITGEACPWASFYDPSRVTLSAAKNFVAENVTAVTNFAEYLAPGELKSVDDLKPGKGAIIREGLRKIAAYRDEQGHVHRVSAACTHVGCHLHWNSFERCWDCPCHGSHFAVDGTALNAPAVGALAPISAEKTARRIKQVSACKPGLCKGFFAALDPSVASALRNSSARLIG